MPKVNLSRNYTYKGKLFLRADNPQEVPEGLAEREKSLSGRDPTAQKTPEEGAPGEVGETAAQSVQGEAGEESPAAEQMGGTQGGEAQPTEQVPEGETPLPDDFPHVDILKQANFHTFESLSGTNLRSIPNIGRERAEDIDAALEENRQDADQS